MTRVPAVSFVRILASGVCLLPVLWYTGVSLRVRAHAPHAPGSVERVSRADADSLQRKLEAIVTFGAVPRLETKATVIHQREVNAYLTTYLREDLPPGVADPRIEIVGDSVLRGTVMLDMDAYRASRPPTSGFDPLAMLSGTLQARARGRLITADGEGRFELDEADLGGIPLPRVLVQQLLAYYSRTAEQPRGIRLDDPFDLPVSIREIRVRPGEAVVIQ
jgi:hypothetical protein